MSGEYSVARRTLDRPPPGFIPYIGFAKGVRSESEKNPREFGRGKKEGGSFLIFHRVIRIRSVSNNFRNLRRFGFDLIYYYVFYVSRRMTSFVSFLSVSFPASRFFLAENSRGKEDGGELRRTNIYPRRAILFDLQFESSSSEWKKWKCMCVCSRASEREGERGRDTVREEDESRRFHPTLLLGVKTQSPGSVYRGYTSKLIFVSPIPPSGIAPNLGFSSIIRPFIRSMMFPRYFFPFFLSFYLLPVIVMFLSTHPFQ